jgi:hypothetical protein
VSYPKDTVPVFVYGFETWLIIFREEHRLRMFENRVLRKICGAKREFQETDGGCIYHNGVSFLKILCLFLYMGLKHG